MRATIPNLTNLVQNPPTSAFMVPVNGRTPHDRAKAVLDQAIARTRHKQIKGYEEVRRSAQELVSDEAEAIDAVLQGIRQLKKDLRRGVAAPSDVMSKVAVSMRSVEGLVVRIQQVARDEEAATAMVDMSPAEYEQALLDRFPALAEATPLLTDEFLRGEAESPFRNEDGA